MGIYIYIYVQDSVGTFWDFQGLGFYLESQ